MTAMNATEMHAKIGKVITHSFGGLTVRVKINDVKTVYGQERYFVSVDGQESNQVWINA